MVLWVSKLVFYALSISVIIQGDGSPGRTCDYITTMKPRCDYDDDDDDDSDDVDHGVHCPLRGLGLNTRSRTKRQRTQSAAVSHARNTRN